MSEGKRAVAICRLSLPEDAIRSGRLSESSRVRDAARRDPGSYPAASKQIRRVTRHEAAKAGTGRNSNREWKLWAPVK